MGDMIDMFRERKQETQESRRQRLADAESRFEEVRAVVTTQLHCELVISAPGHWIVTRPTRPVIQFWPSASKWQHIKTGKITRGDVDKFIRMLERAKL